MVLLNQSAKPFPKSASQTSQALSSSSEALSSGDEPFLQGLSAEFIIIDEACDITKEMWDRWMTS